MEKAKHVTWRLLAVGVCLLTVSSVARADSLDEQRSRCLLYTSDAADEL